MTGVGQIQRPTREEPEVGFLQREPRSVLATLPQTVQPWRGTSGPPPRSPPADPKDPADPDPHSPDEAAIFSALRQFSAKLRACGRIEAAAVAGTDQQRIAA